MKFRIVFSIFALLCFGAVPVFACLPTPTQVGGAPYPEISMERYLQNAAVVFVGTVVREVQPYTWGARFEVRVERYLKGSGFDTVYLDGYGYGTDCAPMIVEPSRIFFVFGPNIRDGIPIYSGINDYPLSEEQAVTAITGQSTAPQPLPLDIQLNRIAENGDLNWLYIPLSILAALLGLVILALSLRRTRRKSKAKREELL